MGGRDYWRNLVTAISIENLDVERLAIDLHSPADEEFVKALSTIGKRIVLTISPESGAYNVRKLHGRDYSDEAYLNTAKYAHKYGIPISFFFMMGLAKENRYDSYVKPHINVVCLRCGAVKDINDRSAREIVSRAAAKSKLTITEQRFDIYGICTKCKITSKLQSK